MTHRRLVTGALALASFLACVDTVLAVTRHVTPTGNDAGTCTQAAPCRQIGRALQLVGPGDTIQVANGSYLGFDVQDLAGTPSAPIVIVAPGRLADITANASRNDTILVYRASYIQIDGLRTFGSPGNGMHISTSDHITVRNCVFGNNTWLGLITGHSDDLIIEDNEAYGSVNSHGIYTANSGDRPIIRRNRVHDNAENGIHMNGDQWSEPGDGIISGALIEDNLIYNNGNPSQGAGINMDGVQDSIIRNNLIYNNRRTGIRMYAYDGTEGPKGMQIYHNTVDLPSDAGTGMSIRQSAGTNTIRNNVLIVRNPSAPGLKFGDETDIAFANSNYNILDRVENENDALYSLAQWKSFGRELNSFSATTTSLWVNPAGGDYHLPALSPAVNVGQTLAAVTKDIEGVSRPQGLASDIGAYERASGPTLSIQDVTVTEGNAGVVDAIFTVTLAPPSPATVTVDWATANGTATAPGDYGSAAETLTFSPGQTTKTITVLVNGDATVEPNETFFVSLAGASGAAISDGQGQATILNDDLAALLSINDVTVTEGNAGTVNANFTVTLAPSSTGTVAVNWATANGTATAPSDYASGSGTLTFTPGQTTKTITVAVNGETVQEPNETFSVNLSGATGATVSDGQGQATITNDDASASSLSINNRTVTEGNAGTVNASFTVTLSPAATGTVTVNWATANGTATAGSDYAAASGTLTFAPGTTTRPITITVNGDTAVEPSETFVVNLTGASGASVSDAQGQGTITNDDSAAALTCPVSPVPPNGTYAATVNTGSSATDWVAHYTPGSPNSPWIGQWKYVPLPRPATMTMTAPGTAGSYELRLFANDGFTVIGSCTFQVGAASVALSINDVTVTEGNAGTVSANFTVTLSPTSSGTVTVNWATANGTATQPSDYTLGSGSLTFSAGQSTKTVTVAVNGDATVEPNETFVVNLSGATGATTSDAQGQGTITNDDGGSSALTCPVSPVPPNGSYTTTVNAGSSARDWLAQYTLGSPNSPWIGQWKYVPLPRSAAVTMTAPGTAGTYELRLFANDGFTVIGSCTFQVGAAGPALSIDDVTVTEGNAGTVNAGFTVTLSPTSSGTVTVNWATANGTATQPSDYTLGSGSLTFLPGETAKTVTVAVNGDTASEPNETFFVNLTGAAGASVSDAQGQGTITNDDGVSAALTCPTSPVLHNTSYAATVSAGSSATDWVAQYTPGSPNAPWIGQWKYVPLPRSATVTMTAPGTAGTYDLRLFANDGFTAIGSCTFQVQ